MPEHDSTLAYVGSFTRNFSNSSASPNPEQIDFKDVAELPRMNEMNKSLLGALSQIKTTSNWYSGNISSWGDEW